MPTILAPAGNMFYKEMSEEEKLKVSLLSSDLGYTYPDGLDWKPSSSRHQNLLDFIRVKLHNSHAQMSKKFGAWRELDNVLKPNLTAESREALERPGDGKKITLVYPHSYAALDTMLSFLSAAFFNDPMLRYSPSGPADVIGAGLMEILVNKWVTRNRIPLDLHTLFRNSLVYGFGVGVPHWLDAGNDGKVSGLDRYGCALNTLDTYRLFLDPACPIEKLASDSEFFGWLEQHTYYNLLADEKTSRVRFNVKYLMAVIGSLPSYLDGRGFTTSTDAYSRTVWTTSLYVKIIPKEFELGDGEYPEIWFFEVGNDQVILQARPISTPRSMTFPIIVGADGFDGCSSLPTARLEAIQGLQTVVDWLITSHIRQARLAINNRLIVDPQAIEMDDLASGKAFIRTRRSALGADLRKSIMQLQISDVTRQHLGDVNLMVNAMRDTIGTDTMAMGSLRDGGPERLTSNEAEATTRGGANRFNRILKVLHMQVMMTLGEDFALLTRENISNDFFVDVPVRYQHLFAGKEFAQIDARAREMLGVVGVDVSVSYSLQSSSNELSGLMELLKVVMQSPVLASMYNVPEILERIFERNGVMDIANLRLAPQVQKTVLPDKEVQKGVQSGRYIPSGQ